MPIPILTVEQMRAWERASWAAGATEAAVISAVGAAVAKRIRSMTRTRDRVLILAGKGNNGADARAAQAHLADLEVELVEVADPSKDRPAVESALARRPALVVDGLFGIGLNRPLSPEWCGLIDLVNASSRPVLAVDLPSGLDADSGETFGTAIVATRTLTVGAPKAGLLTSGAGPFVGRLEVAVDVGLAPLDATAPGYDACWTIAADFEGYPPPRAYSSHKGTFGHLSIMAGSLGYHGAAVLAARGASRARPGLVTVFALPEVYLPIASQLQSEMVHPWLPGLAVPESTTALLIGPGLAAEGVRRERETEVVALWRRGGYPVVADASGLDWLPPVPLAPTLLRIMTPHPGEAARMLRRPVAEIQGDRVRTVRELSRRYSDCYVVLKGHQTVIGRSSGPVYVNSSGNPGLAQGGSGDLLAGLMAGLLAQPALQKDPVLAIRFAVWRHGLAADRLTAQGRDWTVDELAVELSTATPTAD